jgi:hypothetical protein
LPDPTPATFPAGRTIPRLASTTLLSRVVACCSPQGVPTRLRIRKTTTGGVRGRVLVPFRLRRSVLSPHCGWQVHGCPKHETWPRQNADPGACADATARGAAGTPAGGCVRRVGVPSRPSFPSRGTIGPEAVGRPGRRGAERFLQPCAFLRSKGRRTGAAWSSPRSRDRPSFDFQPFLP